MKNMIKNSMRITVLMVAFMLTFSSCNDWTEYESMDIKTPSLESQNPELYAAYLKNLNAYKAGEHKLTLVMLENNPLAPTQQSERISALPDSIDYVSLSYPDALSPVMIKDMEEVRKKGTRVISEVNYPTIEAEWIQKLKLDPSLTEEEALAYITERTNGLLAVCDKYNYDGIIFYYPGRSLVSLTEAAYAVYDGRQKVFLNTVMAWQNKHKGKAFFYMGNPEFLINENKAFLTSCDYIVLMTDTQTNGPNMEIKARLAIGSSDVPSDRFIFSVQPPRPDDEEGIYGFFSATDEKGNKVPSIIGAAKWINLPSDFTRVGILIRRVQNDYFFDNTLTYRNVREAINIMNPSPKN